MLEILVLVGGLAVEPAPPPLIIHPARPRILRQDDGDDPHRGFAPERRQPEPEPEPEPDHCKKRCDNA